MRDSLPKRGCKPLYSTGFARLGATLLGLFFLLGLSMGQPVLPSPIQPTVTAEDGDKGGKFFGKAPEPGRTRHYFVAAEPQIWDYAPQGNDPVCGMTLPPPVVARRTGAKVRYIEYTDESFASRVIPNPRLGILGPVLRGQVGEYLVVTFLNRTSSIFSMHPHGAKYDRDSEGAYYQPKPGLGAAVGPGAKFTYVWKLDESAGPSPNEPSSKGWLYHSHVNGHDEVNLGLIGFIIVTDPKRSRPDGTPSDVDREMASLFMIFDESGLGEAAKEAAEYASLPGGGPPPMSWTKVQELTEQGQRPAINGYIFGNLPGLEMVEGERVRWYLFALGSERDFHTAHWHGARVLEEGRRQTDVVELLPATMKVADMNADNPGSWLFHCHVAEHMQEGMFARFTVHPRETKPTSPGLSEPFFAARKAEISLKIDRADAVAENSQATQLKYTLTIEGSVTVYDAFSVFTEPVTFQIGQNSFAFQPDRKGESKTDHGSFQIRNASPYGVVYGGMMQFRMVLNSVVGLGTVGLPANGDARGGGQAIPCTFSVGKARHSASLPLSLKPGA